MGDEHLSAEFATLWPEYDLDPKTRSLLRYASKLTEAPSMVGKDDVGALAEQGWNEREIWEISALTAFFNFNGRLEAVSGLPPDQIPEGADFAEGRAARSGS